MADFTTSIRWAALAIWLFWLAVYWSGGLRTAGDVRKALAARMFLDAGLMAVMAVLTLVLIATGLLLALGRTAALPWADNWTVVPAGTLLTLAGATGTFYARHYLGRFWTAETTVAADHRIIDHGPYGVVRHPIYTAAIAMYLGGGLAFATWWGFAAALVVVVGYVLKTRLEDGFLADQMAPAYAEYRRRVRYRLVPGVW